MQSLTKQRVVSAYLLLLGLLELGPQTKSAGLALFCIVIRRGETFEDGLQEVKRLWQEEGGEVSERRRWQAKGRKRGLRLR